MPKELSYSAHTKAVLALGLPLAGSHVAQFAIHMTDTLMLGWYDVDALAAVTLAGSFWFLLFIMGSGFAFAVSPMVASALSSGRDKQVRRVTRMGMWASLIYSALVMPLMYWSAPILVAIGQDPDLSLLAQDYLRIACWGTPAALLVMVLKNYLAAQERASIVLWITLIALVMNAVVNYALIFGNWGAPEMGPRGAALASIIMHGLSFLALAVFATKALPEHALFQRFWRLDSDAFGAVFKLGVPIGLTSLAESGLFSATAVMVGWIGTLELAAHGVALNLAGMTFMLQVGLSNAATVRAGQAYGRQDEAGLRRGAIVAIAISLVVVMMIVALFLLVPEPLIGLFLASDEIHRDEIIAIGVVLLAVAALFQIADGTQAVALGLLRGVQDTKVPMVIATIAYWPLGMGTSYLLGFTFGMGAAGVWLGLVVGLGTASALMMWRFWRVASKIGAAP